MVAESPPPSVAFYIASATAGASSSVALAASVATRANCVRCSAIADSCVALVVASCFVVALLADISVAVCYL